MNKNFEIYDDILQCYFGDYIKSMPDHFLSVRSPKNPFKRLLKIVLAILKNTFISFLNIFNNENRKSNVWFFINSVNNKKALETIKKGFVNSTYVSINKKIIKDSNGCILRNNFKYIYLYKLPYLFYKLSVKYGFKIVFRQFDLLALSIGFYETNIQLLKKNKPSVIVFANDTNIETRSLLLAAKKLNIKTVYIQHAFVHESFPPLKFDLSLLEGQASLDIYAQKGEILGEVELIGMPKFDNKVKLINKSPSVKRVGICYNLFDEENELKKLIEQIQRNFPKLIVSVRPHPADKRVFFKTSDKLIVSKPVEDNIFNFLQNQDLIICGNTSVHLEAVLMNVVSLYFNFYSTVNNMEDVYGFVNNGMVRKFNSVEEIISEIQNQLENKQNVRYKAKYYNAVLDTEFEGKSSEKAINLIRNIL